VSLVNIQGLGIRPKFADGCGSCSSCLSFCPGYSVAPDGSEVLSSHGGEEEFGAALEVWEGYATDPEIRFAASSGGVLSALSLYCLEKEAMGFVLHTAAKATEPWLNETVQSRTRAELVSRTGSRYAPASPCDGLSAIENSDSPCVFIGKPCDTSAVMSVRRERPELDRRLGLVMAFFCAGTPSTDGTIALLRQVGAQSNEVESLRYRGEGWPGGFTVIRSDGGKRDFIPYEKAWGTLTKHVPLRCHLCPDGLGRSADISCGDAWEQHDPAKKNPGVSIILVRTQRGREILHRAAAAGYVQLKSANAETVLAAQPNLLSRRRELFGRLLALRLLLIPIPRFRGFSLIRSWMRIPLAKKIRTVAGTLRRAIPRNWWRRRPSFAELNNVPLRDASSSFGVSSSQS
jgi:coenzyme F420 hydrogenase subunit beta